ncbi:hypothetical protein SEPCBS119000_000804 [Sporothrix epigloea]|uniref:Uncharacterized protein n=1 Tax=Sporothrix epigloea TaxID=1892477 RepID=A0ABP0DA44_9PEZI
MAIDLKLDAASSQAALIFASGNFLVCFGRFWRLCRRDERRAAIWGATNCRSAAIWAAPRCRRAVIWAAPRCRRAVFWAAPRCRRYPKRSWPALFSAEESAGAVQGSGLGPDNSGLPDLVTGSHPEAGIGPGGSEQAVPQPGPSQISFGGPAPPAADVMPASD